MGTTDTALDADWLGVVPALGRGSGRDPGRHPDHRRAGPRDGHARQRRRPHAGDRQLRRGRRLRRAAGALRPGTSLLRDQRGARRGRLRRRRRAGDHRPHRRLAERQARRLHYALSVAVADGPTMADVAFGFVHDFGAREQWWARRGEGAWRDGVPLDPTLRRAPLTRRPARAAGDRVLRPAVGARGRSSRSRAVTRRLRALGTIASTLCQVAAARFDAMVTLAAVPRRRRRRGPADRARGRRLHQLRRPRRSARGAAGRDPQLPAGRGPHRRRRCTSWRRSAARDGHRLDPGREDRRLPGRHRRRRHPARRPARAGRRVRAARDRLHRAGARAPAATPGGHRPARVGADQHRGDAQPAGPGA